MFIYNFQHISNFLRLFKFFLYLKFYCFWHILQIFYYIAFAFCTSLSSFTWKDTFITPTVIALYLCRTILVRFLYIAFIVAYYYIDLSSVSTFYYKYINTIDFLINRDRYYSLTFFLAII